MLPTFVITLREGLEAALIIGIIAAFLRQQGRNDALRQMWIGVGLATVLCVLVAVGLRLADQELPERQAEGLAAVVALVAVGFVTYMIVWMSRHARDLRGSLQREAAGALARGSVLALVAMAFFAVLREGFETTVFLLAVFDEATDPAAAGAGGVVGLVAACLLGWGLYRGGVRINLARFFKLTGLVLVLVAAGLVVGALRSAAEAGWLTAGQGQALDLSWLVQPGSVWGSLLTGLFGVQAEPTVLEVVAWTLYAVPMTLFVLAPAMVAPKLRGGLAAGAACVAPLVLIGAAFSDGGGSAATAANGGQRLRVAVSEAGCEPASLRAQSGPATFTVESRGNSKVTELELVQGDRVLGEAENLVGGVTGTFSLTLQPGRYELVCPGGSRTPRTALVVSGARAVAPVAPVVRRGVEGYRRYVIGQADAFVVLARRLQAALRSGDLARSRAAYAAARVPWERAEPVAELFGGLDPAIDGRVNDQPRSQWTGFHPIERRIWIDRTSRGTAGDAAGLVADARRLARLVRRVKLEPATVANGANGLLNEVSKSKITGEEERYSHLDLLDFQANLDGARAAFDAIRPALARRDRSLEREIGRRFADVTRALAGHRRGGRFVSYDTLTRAQVRRLSQLIDALGEPLSQAPARALRG